MEVRRKELLRHRGHDPVSGAARQRGKKDRCIHEALMVGGENDWAIDRVQMFQSLNL